MQAFMPFSMTHLYLLKASPILLGLNLLSVSFFRSFPPNPILEFRNILFFSLMAFIPVAFVCFFTR